MVSITLKSQMPKLPRPAHGLGLSMVNYLVSQQQLVHAQQHGIQLHQNTSMHAHALLTQRLELAHAIS